MEDGLVVGHHRRNNNKSSKTRAFSVEFQAILSGGVRLSAHRQRRLHRRAKHEDSQKLSACWDFEPAASPDVS